MFIFHLDRPLYDTRYFMMVLTIIDIWSSVIDGVGRIVPILVRFYFRSTSQWEFPVGVQSP